MSFKEGNEGASDGDVKGGDGGHGWQRGQRWSSWREALGWQGIRVLARLGSGER